jgi:hypothetical protein
VPNDESEIHHDHLLTCHPCLLAVIHNDHTRWDTLLTVIWPGIQYNSMSRGKDAE